MVPAGGQGLPDYFNIFRENILHLIIIMHAAVSFGIIFEYFLNILLNI